jgi:hypothetical protein
MRRRSARENACSLLRNWRQQQPINKLTFIPMSRWTLWESIVRAKQFPISCL